ncbi:hypothetical protein GW17_00023245 [Ensete ventricosum]|nr:hypothetical protein GW17_00023245 [Ensete ventricosum]
MDRYTQCRMENFMWCTSQQKGIASELRSTAVSQLLCDKDHVVTFGYSHARLPCLDITGKVLHTTRLSHLVSSLEGIDD